MATVSAFQHWLYQAGEPDRRERDRAWRELYLQYNVGVDWSGLDATLDSLWHHKLHFFTVPLYYIEYGLAQMGALQVWRNSLADPDAALAAYLGALAKGATVTLPELFQAAGAELVFETAKVAPLIAVVESSLAADIDALAPGA
jgi:oligoendopeptidase F